MADIPYGHGAILVDWQAFVKVDANGTVGEREG